MQSAWTLHEGVDLVDDDEVERAKKPLDVVRLLTNIASIDSGVIRAIPLGSFVILVFADCEASPCQRTIGDSICSQSRSRRRTGR